MVISSFKNSLSIGLSSESAPYGTGANVSVMVEYVGRLDDKFENTCRRIILSYDHTNLQFDKDFSENQRVTGIEDLGQRIRKQIIEAEIMDPSCIFVSVSMGEDELTL